jgi:hypothetical protein
MARTASAIVLRQASATPAARRSSNRKFEKLEERLKSVGRKAKEVSQETEEAVITVGVPAVLGLLKANGTNLPTYGKYDPLLIWGAPLALLAPKFIGGRMGRRISAAGVGMLSVAAHGAAQRGSFSVSGDEIGYDEDDEIGADDEDDD